MTSTADVLAAAEANVYTELSRADSKASALLGLVGAGLAVLTIAGGHHQAPLVAGLRAAADLALAAAVVLLLLTIRPRLRAPREGAGGEGDGSFVALAGLAGRPGAVLAEAGRLAQAGDVAAAIRLGRLSCLLHAKYSRLRAAVDLLIGGGLLLAAALLLH